MRVFSTFHPAYLLRNPSAGLSVESHLEFLVRALDGRDQYDLSTVAYSINPSPPSYPIHKLSLDIETYGALTSLPVQTQWVVPKSLAYDGVTSDDLVQTIALSWRDPDGQLQNGVYTKTTGFEQVGAFIRRVIDSAGILLGQNFTFDLSFLRAGLPWLSTWLRPPLALGDLSIVNYLHNETRPERSLKSLAPLFAVSRYESGGFRRYPTCDDPELLAYNAQDSASTLLTEEKLWAAIESFYGADSPKLSAFNRQWYSDLLWLVLSMLETGVSMDEGGLVKLRERYEHQVHRLISFSAAKWSMPLQGKGSDRAKRSAISDGLDELEASQAVVPSLVLTKKQKKVSFCDENRNTLLGLLPKTSDAGHRLRIIGHYADCSKILDAYLLPLLVGRKGKKKGTRNPATKLIEGIAYPRWYAVPSQFDDGGAGGTVQSRIVPREPGVQTFPKIVKECICCRFPGGSLLWYDLCLAGNTEIYTVEGFRPIKDVVENKTQGVLTCREDGTLQFVVPEKYIETPPTDFLRIDLVHGEEVYCTPDHKWMLWDGSFKRTDELQVGDRLAHVHESRPVGEYSQLTIAKKGAVDRAVRTHELVADCTLGPRLKGIDVHHKNGNKYDWRASNLETMTISDHWRHHSTGVKNPMYGRRKTVAVRCLTCGVEFYRPPSNKAKYCGRDCWGQSRKNHQVARISPAYKDRAYCLRIPETQNFVLRNGLVSHNCQIELRVAALLSGDPVMLAEYAAGIDRHSETAVMIFSPGILTHRDFKELYRQAGKTLNFLVLFRGGAPKFQATVVRDVGIYIPLTQCRDSIFKMKDKYRRMWEWQDELIVQAKTKGFLELPLIGQSRLYLGGHNSVEAAMNEIVNQPVQTTAANIMLSIQMQLQKEFREHGLRSVSPLNVYDAAPIEIYPGEQEIVVELLRKTIPSPPYFQALCDLLGRTIRLECEYFIDGGPKLKC